MRSTSQTRACIAYVPVPRRSIAVTLATKVINEKLAACANILGPSVSLYQWEGTVATSREFILILKTTNAKFSALEKRIIQLHPYDCPCIAKIEISSLNESYLTWLITAVR